MNFKTNKIILFCNRRLTPQVSRNFSDANYVRKLLLTTKVQAKNSVFENIEFDQLINYILYSLDNYYKGNLIFVFQLLVAFLYVITPVDVVSDFIPFIGYIDDLMLLNLIISTYEHELINFKNGKRQMLDIEYLSIDQKVIDNFDIDPTRAIDLIIENTKLENVNGESLINDHLANILTAYDEYLNIDVIEIIKYEVLNYLAKSKTGSEQIDEQVIDSLIQLPEVVSKKDIGYFLKNIEDIFSDQPIVFTQEKKGIFTSNIYGVQFDVNALKTNLWINFVLVEEVHNANKQVIKYQAKNVKSLTYEHIVEIIDLINKKYLFDNTVIYFEIEINNNNLIFKVDKLNRKITHFCSPQMGIAIEQKLTSIILVIEERIK